MSVRDFEPFVVLGLPHRIEITKAQLPNAICKDQIWIPSPKVRKNLGPKKPKTINL